MLIHGAANNFGYLVSHPAASQKHNIPQGVRAFLFSYGSVIANSLVRLEFTRLFSYTPLRHVPFLAVTPNATPALIRTSIGSPERLPIL